MTNGKRRYAIYGGSFDPIHIGHISLADQAVKECSLDKLIFMPAYVSPFKQDRKVSSGEDRCGMIEAALDYNPAFCLSRYELGRKGPSYTVETLRHWKSLLGTEIGFVLGFDSLIQLDTWYHGEEIIRDYHLITARRPYSDDKAGQEKIQYYRDTFNSNITVLEMEPVDASSTEIRKRASEGRSLDGLVPKGVEEYIIEHKLYR